MRAASVLAVVAVSGAFLTGQFERAVSVVFGSDEEDRAAFLFFRSRAVRRS